MSYGYVKSLPNAEYSRYLKKLDVVGLEECPYNLPEDTWINDPTKWPDMVWPDVCNYLIDTPGVYTMESMKNFKSLEANTLLLSGWVQTVYHVPVPNTTHLVMKANVKPSWRLNDEPHHAWVAVNKNARVLSAHCDCMAGLGESCSHVGALLFKIESAVRGGFTKLACTEKPCEWNKCFTKNILPAPISEIKFYKESSKEKLLKSIRTKKPPPPPASRENQLQFLHLLASSGEKQVGLCGFKKTAYLFKDKSITVFKKLPPSMSNLYSECNGKLSQDNLSKKCEKVLEDIAISQNERTFLRESTTLQSDSLVWHEQRVGRVTASVAHSVLHTNPNKPSQSLIKKICHVSKKQLKVPAIVWGKEKESVALQQYKEAIATQHSCVEVQRTGLSVLCDKPYIGASPDGLITCECCGSGVVEIKCPYSHKDSNLEALLGDPGFYIDGNYQLKTDSQYYSQVQLQMCVLDKEFCHFVVWTKETCIIILVKRDEIFIEDMISKIDNFWKSHCLPELLTHSREDKSLPTTETTVPLFCYCQKPWNENDGTEMIGCDDSNCTYKWIHLHCAKLKRTKKGSWYCKDCRKKKRGA